jgi:hypothetical protein
MFNNHSSAKLEDVYAYETLNLFFTIHTHIA